MIGRTTLVSVAVAIASAATGGAAQGRGPGQGAASVDQPWTLLPVQGRVYALQGAGANVTIQVGDDGALLVDSGTASAASGLLERVRDLTERPVRAIVNSSADADHVGGNAVLAKGGLPLFGAGGGGAPPPLRSAHIFAHENVLLRLSRAADVAPALPFASWPTDTFVSDLKTLHVNGEPIELIHLPAAHTDGDVLVFFRGSDVISAGDVFTTTGYPVVRPEDGGSLHGVLDALNRIIRITVPAFNQQGGTRVVPGHGRIGNEADVVDYRDMLTIIRDRLRAMADRGMTVDQVRAARPTRDYDGLYGSTSDPWTTDLFIAAAYAEIRTAQRGLR